MLGYGLDLDELYRNLPLVGVCRPGAFAGEDASVALELQRPNRPLIWSPVVDAVCAVVPREAGAYLVGGVVRDAYLHRPIHDIDLATPGSGARSPGRSRMRSAATITRWMRSAGLAGQSSLGNGKIIVDVAQFPRADLLEDLRLRDFTVNAMAVPVEGERAQIIDPLGGATDLERNFLRRCGPESIASDPVRGLRAIRASVDWLADRAGHADGYSRARVAAGGRLAGTGARRIPEHA